MRKAWELCLEARISLSPEGQKLLRADLAVGSYFELLLEHSCLADARRLLAQALPKRRALWWGLACARDHYAAVPAPAVAEVLDVVMDFVKTGSEASRRQAEELGMNAAPDDLTRCLALATFFSGDCISPDLPDLAPCPYATGRFVEVAVYLAAVLKDPFRYRDQLRCYLDHGYQLVSGPDLWLAADQPGVPAPVELPATAASFARGLA